MSNTSARPGRPPRDAGIFGLLKPYRRLILLLLLLTLFGNGINLILPKIIANAIDAYPENYVLKSILQKYLGFAILVFVFTWLQGIVQVYA